MPQLSSPALWQAIKALGAQQGDNPPEFVVSAPSEYFKNSRDRLCQVSISNTLVESVCDGAEGIGTLPTPDFLATVLWFPFKEGI
jgi:hypothetical protein